MRFDIFYILNSFMIYGSRRANVIVKIFTLLGKIGNYLVGSRAESMKFFISEI